MLTLIEKILGKDEVKQFRQHLDAARWEDGAKTAGSLARTVKQNGQLDDETELARNLRNHLLRRLGNHPLFISAALPGKIYPPKFNRYAVGEQYDAHIDSAVMPVPHSNVTVRSDLSATLFLSEPDEYDGGELVIESTYGVKTIKLAAGDMVLYPSTTLHRVTPVTRGVRTASFFWIESLVRDAAVRALLFELDQTIQALTPLVPEGSVELVRLTGIYHNLLRQSVTT